MSHVLGSSYRYKPERIKGAWGYYVMDLFCYLMEVFCIPIFFILGHYVFLDKSRLRSLTPEEKVLVRSVFGDQIDVSYVLLNPAMSMRVRKFAYAYVTLNMVHFDQSISDSILLHEMMHVYQYQRYGVVYAFRALAAQRSEEKYDYGGAMGLFDAMVQGKRLDEFNFEQQAQIVEDYYCVFIERNMDCPPLFKSAYVHYAAPFTEELT